MKKVLALLILLSPAFAWGVAGNLAADGSGSAVNVSDTALLVLSGDWGTGTVTLEMLVVDGATTKWIVVTNGTFPTDLDTTQLIQLGAPANLRITIAGSTSPDLDWEIRQ